MIRIIIQIDWDDAGFELTKVKETFEVAGIEIDHTFEPICVFKKRNRFVFRGRVRENAIEHARRIPGVVVFRDQEVESTPPS